MNAQKVEVVYAVDEDCPLVFYSDKKAAKEHAAQTANNLHRPVYLLTLTCKDDAITRKRSFVQISSEKIVPKTEQ